MQRFLILDDNAVDTDRLAVALQKELQQSLEFELICCSDSADPAILAELYDVYFLDIDMPKDDGITIAKRIRDQYEDAVLIFVTSHDNLVFKSFEANPFQFVRKNVFEEDFRVCIDLLKKKLLDPKLFYSFRYFNGIINVKYSDILYFEKYQNDLFIYTTQETYRYRENLSYVEMQINHPTFVRTHHSYLVNLNFVKQLAEQIELWDGRMVPVSRMKAKEVREKYLTYLKGKV